MHPDPSVPYRQFLSSGTSLAAACRRVMLAGALGMLGTMGAARAAVPPSVSYAEGIVNQQIEEGYFWINHNEDTHALHALQRALQIQSDNIEALLMLGAVQVHQGDPAAARQTLLRLENAHGSPEQIAALQQWIAQPPVDRVALSHARATADAGHATQAMFQYRALFPQPLLSPMLEVEYDRVLSGAPLGYADAVRRLRTLLSIGPHDMEARIALDQSLGYRPVSRPEALADMRALATSPDTSSMIRDEAVQVWRRTLDWMGVDPQAAPYYRAWLDIHPDDTVISQRMQQIERMQRVNAGFTALAHDNLDQADAAFQDCVAEPSVRAAATEGLGLVAQRRGDMTKARALLTQAVALDPANVEIHRALAALDAPENDPALPQMWQLVSHHEYDRAWALLSEIEKRHGQIADTVQVRAIILEARHDWSAAKVAWTDLLRLSPGNPSAEAGLAGILIREGRLDEAARQIDRLRAVHFARLPVLEGLLLQARAQATTDPRLRAILLEQALRQLPDNGWDHLHLAQALVALGQTDRAQTLMQHFCDTAPRRTDALQACFAFAMQTHDMSGAAALLAHMPPAAITPDMARGVALVTLWKRLQALPASDAQAVAMLQDMPVAPDPDGMRGQMVVDAMLRRHASNAQAIAVLDRAMAQAGGTLGVDQALAYGGTFVQLGDPSAAQRVMDRLDAEGLDLTPQQRDARQQIRESIVVTRADQYDVAGRPDLAEKIIDPLLAQNPDSVALLLARGRVENVRHHSRQALDFDMRALHLKPDDRVVQATVARDALAVGQDHVARDMAASLMDHHPKWGDTWEIQAELDGHAGRERRQLGDLRHARMLDCATSGSLEEQMNSAMRLDPGCAEGRTRARDERPDASLPFIVGSGVAMPETYTYDPRLTPVQTLDRQAGYLSRALAPQADGNVEIRDRSGQSGLGHLTSINIPMTATIPLSSTRQTVSFSIMPSVLLSGNALAQPANAQQYGTVAANGVRPGFHMPGAVGGVAVGVRYKYDWITADVGSTPLGFTTSNVVGGIELAPQLTRNLTLRVTGERRAVIDSLLSYAGARDPGTGQVWGGVTRNRGHGQLEWGTQAYNVYAGGGYAVMKGTNTVANHEAEAGAGGSAQIWKGRDTQHLRLGLDLVYFGYKRNTYYFTWGQGGYFSPRAFMAALVPVTYDGHSGRWSWMFKGEAGYQHYTQDPTAVFPLGGRGVQGHQTYAGLSTGGLAGNVQARMIYQLTPGWRMGLEGGYSRSGSWDEVHGIFMIHYAPSH